VLECLPAFWPGRSGPALATFISLPGNSCAAPSSLARGPYGWAPIATFVITGLLIVILAVGGARSAAAQAGKWFRGHAARSAGGRVDLGRVSG
jgi:hypothetical protein